VTQKLGQISNIRHDQMQMLCQRISGQLPAPILNSGEIASKNKGFPTVKGSWPRPWIKSYCILARITHRPLPTCLISWKPKKLFVDVRTYISMYLHTYVRTDRHLWDHFISSTQQSRPNYS